MTDTSRQGTDASEVQTELLVIGAGPGGYSAAFRAADLGRKVCLVDRRSTLGGVCLNAGCIPSKALLHIGKIISDAKSLDSYGVYFGPPKVNFVQVGNWKDSVVSRLTVGLADLARRRKVTVLNGSAQFSSPHSVVIAGTAGRQIVTYDQAIIAVGSEPAHLPFLPNDDPRVIDSSGALALAEIPTRLLVIGGGVIGLEMATIYQAFGSRVTIVETLDQIIPGADRDLVQPLHKKISSRCEILLKTKVMRLEPQTNGLLATIERQDIGSRQELFDKVLVAVGRRACAAKLALEKAGIKSTREGIIPVDSQMRTNVPHIFAVGDAVGAPMLAHKAGHQGNVAAEVASGMTVAFDASVIPSVCYTDPEVAWVGLSEREAEHQGLAIEKSVFPWAASGRSLTLGYDEGFTKLIFDAATHRLRGAGIVGPGAGDLIAEAVLAIEMGSDAEDLSLIVHPHPTLSETIGSAAAMCTGTVTDLLPSKRRAPLTSP
jgi:dihydrolipoamide dehydrogenase